MPTASRPVSVPLIRPSTSVPELTVGSFASEGRREVRAVELPAAAGGVVGDGPPELAAKSGARAREVVGPVGEGERHRAGPLQAGGHLVRGHAWSGVDGWHGHPPRGA